MSQIKQTYDFKSVGKLQKTFDAERSNSFAQTPIGILTPISFDNKSSTFFKMSYSIGQQIKDNLKNLLQTSKGERLLLCDFGADIKNLAYDVSSEDVMNEIIRRIATCVSKYMPFVSLLTFEPSVDKTKDGITFLKKVVVYYDVPSANIRNQSVEAVLVISG